MPDSATPAISGSQSVCIAMESGKAVGYLVIDRFVDGRSHGGVRLRPDVTLEEVGLLARTMSQKYAFLGLPFGGAKAGVIGDPEAPLEERRSRLGQFGRALAELLRRELFVPAADMGTNHEDIRHMLREAGVRLERRRLPPVPTGLYTAHSVVAGLREMAHYQGRELAGLKVAVEGFGKVGSQLGVLLAQAGARVVAISTSEGGAYDPAGLDIPQLERERARLGSQIIATVPRKHRIAADALPGLPVDALCPCALLHSIHDGNAEEVQAPLLCPGANNPWTESAASILEDKGAMLLPDFAANSGGVLGSVLAYACFTPQETERFIERQFRGSTRWLLERSGRERTSLRRAGEDLIALRREQQGGESVRGSRGWLQASALALHRRGMIPGSFVRPLARGYFLRMLRLPVEA